MSPLKPQVVQEGETIILQNNERNNTNTYEKTDKEYSKDLQSRFGTAFLPYASQLESVEKKRIIRKRKGKNKKKKPVKVTKIPGYHTSNRTKGKTFDNQCNNNRDKIRNKIGTMDKRERAKKRLEWFGDTMTYDDGWPNVDKRNTMQIFHINLNGITSNNNYLEWEMTIAFLMDMQVDVFGLSEMNLDLNNGMVKDNILQSGKHFDPYIRMATSSSLQKVGNTPFKMGGTVTGTNGCWSGRINEQGSDKLGRWSYMKLQARQNQQIVFITVYIPGKQNNDGGGTTIYSQMEADLLMDRGNLLDPKKELLKDLHNFIERDTKKGNIVFLMGDMNEDMGLEEGQVHQFLKSLGMYIPYTTRHGDNLDLPATHDRGKKCLDIIGCSEQVKDSAIVRAGYAPFYYNFFTDHRGVFVDIDIESIFNNARPDTTRQIHKRFTTVHVPKCSKYLQKLEDLMEEANVFKKVDELEAKYIGWAKKRIITKKTNL